MIVWESPFRNLRTAAVLCWALSILVFLNAYGNDFAFDDVLIVLQNFGIQSLDRLPQALVEPYWPGRYGQGLGLWRPVTTGVLGLQWAVFGGNPVGFHLVNILFHSGVTVLVVLVLGELLPVTGAFVGGLLFAVHPVHVEAVANVVGFSEILAAFFFLWACLLILRGGERMGPGRIFAVLALYGLAFLTKESAVTLLGVVLLLDSSHRDITLRDLGSYLARRWALYGGMLLVVALVLMGRHMVLGTVAHPYAPLGGRILTEIPRIWTVAASWPHLLRLLFFPLDLSSDYNPAVIPILTVWNAQNTVGAILVLGILVLALLSWRQGPMGPGRVSPRALGWGVVWVLITLSPTSNLLFLSGILLAERTLYLPSVGFMVAAAWALLRLREVRPRLALGVTLAAVAFGVGRTWTRTPTWKNNLEVFNTLITEHPEAARSQWLLGDSYFTLNRIPEGLRAYRVAVGLAGDSYNLMVGVARNLLGVGLARPAEHLLKQAWEQRPEYGVAPGLLAHTYFNQGRHEEAVEAARFSISRDSTDASQYHTLARSLRALGRFDEAVEARRAAISGGESGHMEQWIWLMELQLLQGDTAQALLSGDSARLRIDSVRESRQFDSIMGALGFGGE